MGHTWCFHDTNPSGSISFLHTPCCFTAFSCLGWEKASSCFQFWLENYFISPSQLSLLGWQLPAGVGAAPRRGGVRPPAARNAFGCRLTRCRRGHERTGLGLQTLNGVMPEAAPAGMIAPLVVEGNCSSSDLKVSELLTAVGRSECLVGWAFLWKGRPPLAGDHIWSHSYCFGKRHCWTTAVVICRRWFTTATCVSCSYSTICVDCQGSKSTTKVSTN